ncbi:proliferating cell nuclear antigen (pcna) [archaeon]|nr:proliferating cell nuclear antigen (pcna) [archaeon]|tara:strand:+ start:23610 stop:24350 length:741 start_codon:yes stop_codon:yes gene_type:complete
MKLILDEPKYLKNPIAIISELVNEVVLKFDKDKMELIAMDPANVALINFKLLSSAFTEYSLEEDVEVGVNLDNLKQILRRAKPSDKLSLELKNNKLKMDLEGENKRTFNLSLIDIENQKQRIPDLKFTGSIDIGTSLFDEAIEDMGVVADSVTLVADKEQFSVQADGTLSNAVVQIDSGNENVNLKVENVIKSKYSLEYLRKIIKGSSLSDSVSLNFGNDYPLRIDYKILDKLNLSVILAPRVAND